MTSIVKGVDEGVAISAGVVTVVAASYAIVKKVSERASAKQKEYEQNLKEHERFLKEHEQKQKEYEQKQMKAYYGDDIYDLYRMYGKRYADSAKAYGIVYAEIERMYDSKTAYEAGVLGLEKAIDNYYTRIAKQDQLNLKIFTNKEDLT